VQCKTVQEAKTANKEHAESTRQGLLIRRTQASTTQPQLHIGPRPQQNNPDWQEQLYPADQGSNCETVQWEKKTPTHPAEGTAKGNIQL
jgi:hypothetical protein